MFAVCVFALLIVFLAGNCDCGFAGVFDGVLVLSCQGLFCVLLLSFKGVVDTLLRELLIAFLSFRGGGWG